MTPQSSYKIIKEKLPEPYLTLIRKYIGQNRLAKNLPHALILCPIWHPSATQEGYEFWHAVYDWSIGKRKNLPIVKKYLVNSFHDIDPNKYDSRYTRCYKEATKAIESINMLFGVIELNRYQPNIYKRYILFNYLMENRSDLFSLETIGQVVADILGRKERYNHATLIHARRNDLWLTETNDQNYLKMKREFNQAIGLIEQKEFMYPSQAVL